MAMESENNEKCQSTVVSTVVQNPIAIHPNNREDYTARYIKNDKENIKETFNENEEKKMSSLKKNIFCCFS